MLVVLYGIVLLWTLGFGYAMYVVYRGDVQPSNLVAHPRWKGEGKGKGQRQRRGGREVFFG